MADEFVRRSFTRHRLGAIVSLPIPVAWLKILGPLGGAPQILDPVTGSDFRSVAAHIRVGAHVSVRVDDFLRDDDSGRVFVVGQIQPEVEGTNLLHCAEIRPPIPDEFQENIEETFWTQEGLSWGRVFEGAEGTQRHSLLPAAIDPSDAESFYQEVSGAFDVWTRLRTDAGAGGAVRHALLGAFDPATDNGVFVGVRDNGGSAELVRLDGQGGLAVTATVGVSASSATYYYVRIKRAGSRIRTFYKITPGEPAAESDWTEVVSSMEPASVILTDDVRVGLFAFCNNANAGEARFQFLRNWAGQEELNNIVAAINDVSPAFLSTGDSFTTSSVETVLKSFTIEGGTFLPQVHYFFDIYGVMIGVPITSVTIRAKFAGVTFLQHTAAGPASPTNFYFRGSIANQGGINNVGFGWFGVFGNTPLCSRGEFAADLNNDNVFEFTAQITGTDPMVVCESLALFRERVL